MAFIHLLVGRVWELRMPKDEHRPARASASRARVDIDHTDSRIVYLRQPVINLVSVNINPK